MGPMSPIIWIVLAVILLLIEAATPQFVTIWFAAGAVISMVLAIFNVPTVIQIAVFVVSSILLLMFTRPLYRKFIKSRHEATNADSLIGQTAIVTEAINNDDACGLVKVKGQIWSAKASGTNQIEQGCKVRVLKIEGVKLVTELVSEE